MVNTTIGRLTPVVMIAISLIVYASRPAHAALVTYVGVDSNANATDPRPNSDAAAANFDAAVLLHGPRSLITFESAPLGIFTNLDVAEGVSLATNSSDTMIRDNPGGLPSRRFGYNTTPDGARFLRVDTSATESATFTFSQPIHAFGAYISGGQDFGHQFQFNDGSDHSIPIPNPGFVSGGITFVGFTNFGAAISSVTIIGSPTATDRLAIDDVRFGRADAVAVPEPSSVFLGSVGALGLLIYRRRLP